MIPSMNANDALKIAGAVVASLGGGGAIVLGLSGYLGKIWADRGLERQKQEYAQLSIVLTNRLELASKQVQVELDRLGLLNKLRSESEFQELVELWKGVARLRFAFSKLPNEKYNLQSPDDAATHHRVYLKASAEFEKRLGEVFELWNEKALSIPQGILQMSTQLVNIAEDEWVPVQRYPDPFDGTALELSDEKALADFMERRSKHWKDFASKSEDLLAAMRKHLQGNATNT
jgi:hypothetical protein